MSNPINQNPLAVEMSHIKDDIQEIKQRLDELEDFKEDTKVALSKLEQIPAQVDELRRFMWRAGTVIAIVIIVVEAVVILAAPALQTFFQK